MGFDIVIANPPYIQLQRNKGELADLYQGMKYETFDRTGDIYCLFYEIGLNLLKDSGILTYISSNKWMRAGYGEKLRKFFIKYNPLLLIDLGPGIFESATVDTNILVIKKLKNKNKLKGLTLTKEGLNNLEDFVKNSAVKLNNLGSGSWFIGSSAEQRLKEKIERIGKPLKDWDVSIYRGILTGLNEAFIIDDKKRDEILQNCEDEDEVMYTNAIIKPILRGRDIKGYSYEWAGLWVIVIPAGWTNINRGKNNAEKFFKDTFSSIYQHLKSFEEKAKKRDDQGDYWWELRHCTYYSEFEKEKVVWGNISYNSTFSFVERGMFINAPANILISDNGYTKYLCGVMNSKIFDWEFKQVGIFLGYAFEWKKQYVEQVHVPRITSQNQPLVSQIESLVDQILLAKKKDPNAATSSLEKQIDILVYQLYGLTDEEVKIVEEQENANT
jgi:type II restriction/modification system DNA methylase subunit YeeA